MMSQQVLDGDSKENLKFTKLRSSKICQKSRQIEGS